MFKVGELIKVEELLSTGVLQRPSPQGGVNAQLAVTGVKCGTQVMIPQSTAEGKASLGTQYAESITSEGDGVCKMR